MEIRSSDHAKYLEIENEHPTPPPYVNLSVKQSAKDFTGKVSPIWVAEADIEFFLDDLQNLGTSFSSVLRSQNMNENSFKLTIIQNAEREIILKSSLGKIYYSSADYPCSLQSKIEFKIGAFTVKDIISFFEGLLY